jgi:ferrous iron transport protein A
MQPFENYLTLNQSKVNLAPQLHGTSLTLNQLNPGSSGKIVNLKASGLLLQRLLALGFTPGSEITTVRRAPLQDPILFKLKGTSISLRKADAEKVTIVV